MMSGIRDGDSSDPGWKKVGSGIRDKHPGHWEKQGIFCLLLRREVSRQLTWFPTKQKQHILPAPAPPPPRYFFVILHCAAMLGKVLP
jgi:hypothetical protein